MIGFIYRILCVPTNESYIGQTVDINRRKNKHFGTLRGNKHENPKLQNAWNKYGEENFSFEFWTFDNITSEQLDNLECEYIEKYNSLEKGFNLVPGGGFLPSKQKIKDEDIVTALCYLEKFGDGYGKTIEEFFNWSKGTFSNLKTKNSYLAAKEKFAILTNKEKENRIKITKDEIEQLKLKRQLKQGGCEQAYKLKTEDFNFAFAAQELNFNYTQVANYLKIKPSTVKDWFNHRSRKKEYNNYLQLNESDKEILFKKVKEANLIVYDCKRSLKYNEEDILNYLCYKKIFNGLDSLIQNLFGWAEGTCYNIRKPDRYKTIKAKFEVLPKEEIQYRANLVNSAVLKSRN